VTPAAQASTIVRLHRRRLGWTWVAVCSLFGLVAYVAVGAQLFDNLTGTSELLSDPGFRAAGPGADRADCRDSRHRAAAPRGRGRPGDRPRERLALPVARPCQPLSARHASSWVFGIVMLAAMTTIAVAILPEQVNSVA
jgi:hypothetical protein